MCAILKHTSLQRRTVECITKKHRIVQVTLYSQNILNNAEMGMRPQITFTSLAKIIWNFKGAQNRSPTHVIESYH